MRSNFIAAAVLFVLLIQVPATHAFETDQFNLPVVPLADIGDEVAEYTGQNIRKAVDKLNAEIATLQKCLDRAADRPSKCRSDDAARKRLGYLRSNAAAAREVYNRLGWGIIAFARASDWMNTHQFRSQPARYKTSYRQSIYVSLPTDYLTISPTVKMYGSSFGTDKIAHIFREGYKYYRIYEQALAKGLNADDAVRKAVSWGRMTENTYYGTLVGGVFSNADLAANYAGLEFYRGLTAAVTIGNVTRPPTLVLNGGVWALNDAADASGTLLRPFISDHLNEAFNPSIYIAGLRSSIRGIVRKRACPKWRELYADETREDFDALTNSLTLWNGKDYGFKVSRSFVTIGNTCFADDTDL